MLPRREAKYLQLIGVHVPEAARTLLLQEEKFNYYFSQLSFAVSRLSKEVFVVADCCCCTAA